MDKTEIFFLIIVGLLLVTSGFALHGAYNEIKNKRQFNGLYIHNSNNFSTTIDHAYSRDKRGDWVCINVAYDMSPKLAYETCVHECSHKAYSEIFAEKCEDNFETCLEVIQNE